MPRAHTCLLKVQDGLKVLPLLVDELHILFAGHIAVALFVVALGLDLAVSHQMGGRGQGKHFKDHDECPLSFGPLLVAVG